MRHIRHVFLFFLLLFGIAWNAQAALQAVGPVTGPHGYPQWYQDSTRLKLELCPSSDPMCISAPPVTPAELALGVGEESFWWSADAQAAPLVPGGKAQLTLALEGAFGGDGSVKDGQQIVFGRIRIRFDAPTPGRYEVYHPFSATPVVFENVTVADGVFYTEDLGSLNFLDQVAGYAGALQGKIGPFLTWPNYNDPLINPNLQVPILDPVTQLPTGQVVQHVGDINVPHQVVGSPFPVPVTDHPSGFRNYFRIVGPNNISTETDLFAVTGRVLPDPAPEIIAYVPPPRPPQKLFAVGAVNEEANYPIGFPIWYQDNAGTLENALPGLQLTICPGGDPMCISEPVDQTNPVSRALNVGEEAFWWSGEAFINDRTTDVDNAQGLDGILVMAIEAAFGGTGAVNPGDQIAFGRVRIRVDVPRDGTYTISHPYGTEVFENVTRDEGINYTRDIGVIDPLNRNAAFAGALSSDIGPRFLTWPNYADPLVNPTLQVAESEAGVPTGATIQYVGDPAVPHQVVGSVIPDAGEPSLFQNYFRIQGPNGIDVKTRLFVVTGKVYDPVTFQVVPNPNAPVAVNDEATTEAGVAVTVNLLENDTVLGNPVVPANTTVTILPVGETTGPFNGTVGTPSATGTVTYTPASGFAGTDTFAYTITVNGLISNIGTVTVTVTPVETIAVTGAQLDLRKLQWNIQGTSTANGTTLTLYAGADLNAPIIGTTTVTGGRWSYRGQATSRPAVNRISIRSSTGKTLLNQPLRVR